MSRLKWTWMPVLLLLAGCDSATAPRAPNLRVSDVTLGARGDTVTLTATVAGQHAPAEWESLDPAVVAVSEGGRATALAAGTARVRAEYAGTEATATVTVLPPVDVRLSELKVVTDPNGSTGTGMRIRNDGGRGFYRLEFWRHGPAGTKQRMLSDNDDREAVPGLDISYENFIGGGLPDWVVAYSREPLSQVPVRSSCVRLDGVAGPCPSDLPDPPAVHSLLVVPAAGIVQVGDSILYTVRAFDASGAEITGRPVTWTALPPSVVSIDERGMLRALAPGYAQVTASVDGVASTVGLTSTAPAPPAVDSVWLAPRDTTVEVGDTVHYVARSFAADGTELTGRTVSWSTSTPLVLSLGNDGRAVARAAGSGVVAATVEGISAVVGLTVRTPVAAIEAHSTGILFTGEAYRFVAHAVDANGSRLDDVPVSWSSSDPGIVETAPDGTMTARATGSVVVRASARDKELRIPVRVAAAPTAGLVLTVTPTFGPPQLAVQTLGPSGSWRVLTQGAGLREPVASPDGSRIAFVMETSQGGADIFVINADGSGLRRLTTNPGPDDQPTWSPDGLSLAFRSYVSGLPDIWVIGVDGGGLRNLTDLGPIRIGTIGVERPAWSPNGEWVAFSWGDTNVVPRRMSLRMIRRDGSETRAITALAGYDDTEPSFSPEGDRIVFRRNGAGLQNRILITDLSGNIFDPGADLGTGRTPRWSPDGAWVVYLRPSTLIAAPGALVLRKIGWNEERVSAAAADVGWMPRR